MCIYMQMHIPDSVGMQGWSFMQETERQKEMMKWNYERESESAFTRPLFLNWMNMQAFAYVKHGVDCTWTCMYLSLTSFVSEES